MNRQQNKIKSKIIVSVVILLISFIPTMTTQASGGSTFEGPEPEENCAESKKNCIETIPTICNELNELNELDEEKFNECRERIETDCEAQFNICGASQVSESPIKKEQKLIKTPFIIPSGADTLNPFKGATIETIVGRIIKMALGILGSITLVIIIYAGTIFMLQGSNADKRKKSLETMVWAALGTIVILSSYVLIKFIFDSLHIL